MSIKPTLLFFERATVITKGQVSLKYTSGSTGPHVYVHPEGQKCLLEIGDGARNSVSSKTP